MVFPELITTLIVSKDNDNAYLERIYIYSNNKNLSVKILNNQWWNSN